MIVHLAEEPDGLIQRCADCSEILVDYTNAQVVSTVADRRLPFWPTNSFIVVDGIHSCTMTDEEELFYRCSLSEA